MKQIFLTNNLCYKKARIMTPIGIMVHSTGANNPYISRYVQPDNGLIGDNKYDNDWNRSDLYLCVHGFLGKEESGNVEFYQTLPFNYIGWHAGGDANNNYVSFEICEDALTDSIYFEQCYNKAIEACVEICKEFPTIQINNIIGHYEGYNRGIASNHADPGHWFEKFNKTMDMFRKDVELVLNAKEPEDPRFNVSEWAKDAQTFVMDTGISDGTNPKSDASREEFWTMLYRLIDDHTTIYSQPFGIIDSRINGVSEWAKDAQTFVMDTGISDGTNPSNDVTREQIWTMLYRISGSENKTIVQWIKESGISDATNPKDNATREEVWTMLKRYYDFVN